MRTGCQLGWNLASKIHQNLLLDSSWAVLWLSWAVLGRLGGLLRRLEEASKTDTKKGAQIVGKKCVFRRLGGRVNEIMLALHGGRAGDAGLLRRQEPPIIKTEKALRRKPYTQKKYLQRVSAESECRE